MIQGKGYVILLGRSQCHWLYEVPGIRKNQNLTSFLRSSRASRGLSSTVYRLTSAPEHRRVAEHANQQKKLVSSIELDSETVS